MTGLWQRGEIRDTAWALLFALWCVAWVTGLVAATQGAPEIVTLQGNAGLRQTVATFIPLPYGVALFAWGVTAFVPMWVLLRLRRRLDPDGQCMASIRWSLSSKGFNLAVMVLAITASLVALAGASETFQAWSRSISPEVVRFLSAWWFLLLLIASALFLIPVLMCLLNPHTLARDRLERWWRPFWPGVAASAVAIACWGVIPALAEYLLDASLDWNHAWVFIPLLALNYLVAAASDLIAFAWWFSMRRTRHAVALAARLFRWSTLRAYLGFDLALAVAMIVIAVPVLLLSIFTLYVVPQYDDWQEAGMVDMPTAYDALASTLRAMSESLDWMLPGLTVLGVYLVIARGRLLYRLVEPDLSPSADSTAR
ncbi:MAG TPA: hypothetical protein VGE64_08200 [Xanthomonadaceae bacterium]